MGVLGANPSCSPSDPADGELEAPSVPLTPKPARKPQPQPRTAPKRDANKDVMRVRVYDHGNVRSDIELGAGMLGVGALIKDGRAEVPLQGAGDVGLWQSCCRCGCCYCSIPVSVAVAVAVVAAAAAAAGALGVAVAVALAAVIAVQWRWRLWCGLPNTRPAKPPPPPEHPPNPRTRTRPPTPSAPQAPTPRAP